jgi:hypothetical protein
MWLISFNQIRKQDSLAAEYLSFMACINPRDIPLRLLPPGPSQIKQNDALEVLKAYSFITINQFLNIHRLVHLAIRNWLRSKDTLEEWTIKAEARLMWLLPGDVHRNRRLWQEYLPHAQSILQRKEFHNQWNKRMNMCLQFMVGKWLFSDGRYNEAEELFLRILENDVKTQRDYQNILASAH